jgi:hypothetical protein
MGIFRRLIPTANLEPFIIEVSVTAGDTFTLPLVTYGPNPPSFFVDWGDGSEIAQVTSVTDTARIHTYDTTGTYEIVMQGYLPGWSVNNNTIIRDKITGIIDFGRTGLQRLSFFGCSNINSIPSNATMIANGGTDIDNDGNRDGNGIGYAGLANIVDFSGFLRGTSITSIPSGLLDFATSATNMSDAFSFTDITSVPEGLFANNPLVTNFSSTFNGCISLTSVPSDPELFSENENALSFSATFRNCIALTNVLSFSENPIVTVFDRVYDMYTTSNALTGTAPEIWLRTPQPSGNDAFRNCTGLDNFASIPTAFK